VRDGDAGLPAEVVLHPLAVAGAEGGAALDHCIEVDLTIRVAATVYE
jgi:hypothetical protein